MAKLFFTIITIASVAWVSGAAAGGNRPICNQNPGDWYNPADRQCHPATDRHERHGRNDGHPTRVRVAVDPAEIAFRADCDAHGGTVYSASEWNAMGQEPHLRRGQLHCQAGGSWTVD